MKDLKFMTMTEEDYKELKPAKKSREKLNYLI